MADNEKVVINLSTGLEDPERVMIAFLVGGAALDAGKVTPPALTGARSASRILTD